MIAAGPRSLAALVWLTLGLGACGNRSGGASGAAPDSPAAQLNEVLPPDAMARALGTLGGAHVNVSARFSLVRDADTDAGAREEAVSTTTDLILDKGGHYHLKEENDRDGGREIVHFGRELAVALRYGRMIRRPAREAETDRYLQEAVSAPWAAWEVARQQATVTPAGDAAAGLAGLLGAKRLVYKVTLGEAPAPAARADESPLRAWRTSIACDALEGELVLLERPGRPTPPPVVLSLRLQGSYRATRDGHPLRGSFAVTYALQDVGGVPDVAAPAAEPLHTLQRTSLEERALLGKGK